jgi:predicted Zn-ribbon and HTH transcriptional regulator
MPIIIKCHSCGFILYQGNELRSIDAVLRGWGYRCPVCMSPLSNKPVRFFVEARDNVVKHYDRDVIRELIISLLRQSSMTTTEIIDSIAKQLNMDTTPPLFRETVRKVLLKLEKYGVIERVGKTSGITTWRLKES